MENRLMEIVANYGTGNDILALAKLLKGVDPNANVPFTPITQIRHEQGNIWNMMGFTPNETFASMAQLEDGFAGSLMTELLEKVLQNQQLTEQMAIIAVMLCQKLPPPFIGTALGGSPAE